MNDTRDLRDPEELGEALLRLKKKWEMMVKHAPLTQVHDAVEDARVEMNGSRVHTEDAGGS